MRTLLEKESKIIKKSLSFETSGETFSVEICLENVSPIMKKDVIISFLEKLFEQAKEDYLLR